GIAGGEVGEVRAVGQAGTRTRGGEPARLGLVSQTRIIPIRGLVIRIEGADVALDAEHELLAEDAPVELIVVTDRAAAGETITGVLKIAEQSGIHIAGRIVTAALGDAA